MRSLIFSMLVLGAIVAILYSFVAAVDHGPPAPDYPDDARMIITVRPSHTIDGKDEVIIMDEEAYKELPDRR